MTWILSQGRRHVDFLDPQPDQIHILDIAAGLANESRFAGQTRSFYSVAQHSVTGSYCISKEHRLEFLLHDATEAYMKDLPRPLKELLPDYKVIEKRLDAVIRYKYGLPEVCTEAVKEMDVIMLATERRDLMPRDSVDWQCIRGVLPLDRRIDPANPYRAASLFIRRWVELTEGALCR